jgi:flagellar hook protein FlgE
MYQTTQTASGATETKGGVNARQIGLGAKSGAISTAIESQGATQTTNNPFDIMITGDSFFIVNNGKENLYTRDGSFYIDGAGNLAMQSNGYFVQGWVAQEDKETGEIRVNKNGGLSPLQIMSADNSTYSPASTTAALFSGNIDDHDTNVTSDDGKTITLEFYDNKGYLYTGKFTLKDTGTDHLFSLQLTDILDSDGNTINKNLNAEGTDKVLDHITFGDRFTYPEVMDAEHFKISPDTVNNTATFSAVAGTVEFEDIPATGTLSDLKGTKLLKDVYGLTDEQITNSTTYKWASAYKIDSDGQLIVSFTEKVQDNVEATNNYSYVNSGSAYSYYVDTNGKGYVVPNASSTPQGMSSLNKTDLVATLKNMYTTMSDADRTKYLNADNGYTYMMSSDNKTMTVTRSNNLSRTADTSVANAEELTKTELDKYKTEYFIKSTGTDLADISAAYDTTYNGKVFYTYNGSDLVVYGSKLGDAQKADVGNWANNDLAKAINLIRTNDSTDSDFSGQYVTLYVLKNRVNDLKDAEGNPIFTDAAALEAAFKSAFNITEDIDPKKYSFLIENLTGTDGIEAYVAESSYVIDPENKLFTGKNFSQDYTAKAGYDVKNETKSRFDNADGSVYVTFSNQDTLDKFKSTFLNDVFGVDVSSYIPQNEYSVSLVGGKLTISHETDTSKTGDPITIVGDYSVDPSKKKADGTTSHYNYVTTKAKDKYVNVPMKGNIKDLMQVDSGSDSAFPGLLKNVYGLSDEDADAYGADGTYEILQDGSINLTTGKHSAQLLFNAANGSLISAGGDTSDGSKNDGLVNLVFEQSIPGLEAFGYQKQSTDGADVITGRLTVDFSTVTNYNTSGSSTIKAVKGDKKSLNTGRAVGEMNGVNISTDGQIYATYSNGQTKLLGQIASAQFANASGLSKEGDNLYASTLNSGEATVQDITTDGGYMNTGVLEMSNVDLSREFTEMITTQRGFQANSRIITVSDTLLEELTNLKR